MRSNRTTLAQRRFRRMLRNVVRYYPQNVQRMYHYFAGLFA